MDRADRHLAGLAQRLDHVEAGGGKRGDAFRSGGCPDGPGRERGLRGKRGRLADGQQPELVVRRAQRLAAVLRAFDPRSEEHTSELQSLMRISYAVFCLKKKKTHITNTTL